MDLFNPETGEWLWQKMKKRFDEGIDGWWCDLGEPEVFESEWNHINGKAYDLHNVYCLAWVKILYDHFLNDYPGKRPVFFARAGWGGIQRYGSYHFSGDEQRSWNGIKAQVPMMLNAGLSLLPFWHTNAGGFVDLGAPFKSLNYIPGGCSLHVFRR